MANRSKDNAHLFSMTGLRTDGTCSKKDEMFPTGRESRGKVRLALWFVRKMRLISVRLHSFYFCTPSVDGRGWQKCVTTDVMTLGRSFLENESG
jgi:hypothetical protein